MKNAPCRVTVRGEGNCSKHSDCCDPAGGLDGASM